MKLGMWTGDKMRGGGGKNCFAFKGRRYQRGGSAWFVYAHHTSKAHGARLNLHALSLKQSHVEIANVSHTRVNSKTTGSQWLCCKCRVGNLQCLGETQGKENSMVFTFYFITVIVLSEA